MKKNVLLILVMLVLGSTGLNAQKCARSSIFKAKDTIAKNYFSNRYYNGESAFGLKKGQLNYSYYNFVMNDLEYGLSNHFTANVNYNFLNLFNSRPQLLGFGLKYSVPIIKNRLQWSIKALTQLELFGYVGYGVDGAPSRRYITAHTDQIGIQTHLTYGNRFNNITLGYGRFRYMSPYHNIQADGNKLFLGARVQVLNHTSLFLDAEYSLWEDRYKYREFLGILGAQTHLFDRLSILYGAILYVDGVSYHLGSTWYPMIGLNYRFR